MIKQENITDEFLALMLGLNNPPDTEPTCEYVLPEHDGPVTEVYQWKEPLWSDPVLRAEPIGQVEDLNTKSVRFARTRRVYRFVKYVAYTQAWLPKYRRR